jgi:hydrogenase maturation protease
MKSGMGRGATGNRPGRSEADGFLEALSHPGPQQIVVAGRLLKPGSRVRLKPRPGGDLLDMTLAGRVAAIEGVEHDDGGAAHVAVVLEDDPGRDMGAARHPAHRFFFAPEEMEPIDESAGPPGTKRLLVAGIGNVYLGDDGFGVAVAQWLAARQLPPEIEVVDFGIRSLDLAYALGQPYEAAILVDTVPHAGCPGRLRVIEPEIGEQESPCFESHRMNPEAVLRLARRLGELRPRIFLIGCEPAGRETDESMSMSLSPPVAAAVERAATMVLELAGSLLARSQPEADNVKCPRTMKQES